MRPILVIIAMLLLPAVAHAAPSIRFESDTHDFGQIKPGDEVRFTFKFLNAGTDDLIINKIHSS